MFANAHRGLYVAKTQFRYFDEGAYGLVFRDIAKNRALKIFIQRDDRKEKFCRKVYDAEYQAFKCAAHNSELKQVIPEFYGTLPRLQIFDGRNQNVTDELHPHLNYEMEFIEGGFQKIGKALTSEEFEKWGILFRKAGILHLTDASVVLHVDGSLKKVIDFALAYHEPEV